MQGVIKAYDPVSGIGIVMCDTDLADYPDMPERLFARYFPKIS